LIVVELCGGILSETEALIWTGIKIQKLYVCEIDLEARTLAAARLQVLSKMFSELLPSEAFASCFSFLPQDIALIKQEHVQKLGPVDLIICGFPCQGFSRATRRAQGLRDLRSLVFFDMVNLIHEITYTHGNWGWLIESVDATDHKMPWLGTSITKWSKESWGQDTPLMLSPLVSTPTDFDDLGRTLFQPLCSTVWWKSNFLLVLRINLCKTS
jgi:hypothetical protein